MRSVTRALVAAVVTALLATGVAAANHLDPRKEIRPADQARARAVLLRAADLGPGYRVERTSGLEPHLTCRALDESDLTVTGAARTPFWARELRIFATSSALYRSQAESARAWSRSTSPAGLRCLRETFSRSIAPGAGLQASLRRLPFPRVAQATAAFRIEIADGGRGNPRLFVDFVLLRQGRAQAALVFVSLVAVTPRADEARLARLVGARMASAMRGA